ncbi:MAG: class I SAM-dependent methyltransferase, partial [Acidobacteria bacterium]
MSRSAPGPQSYGREYYRQAYGLDEMRRFSIHWWSARFYALLARRVLRRAGGRRVLEVGCGHGYTLARLEREFETFGIDLSEYAVGRAREIAPRSRVFEADLLGELPEEVAGGGFDLVLAKYVLEHLPQPQRALERIRGLLSPTGRLLYSVPDTTSPSRRFRGDQWYALLDETHVSLLDPPEWLELTRQSGFSIERVFSDGIWDMPWFPRLPVLPQYALFCLPTMLAVGLARPILPAGWGENLIVVA